jgi:oligopeptide/dipeptide ABC transporter ATP-binding protein
VLIHVDGLTKLFRERRGGVVTAVDDMSFTVERGETVGLVGESGSGKSTVGRCLVGLTRPDAGRIIFDGTEVHRLSLRELRSFHRRVQIVFQDAEGSMNPSYSVRGWLADALRPLDLSRRERAERIRRLLEQVGLDDRFLSRKARELSGGQLQRVAIARALAPEPDFVFLDEPTSALDLSIKGQIVNLLADLQEERGYSYLFASHDLAVVRALARSVIVMYLGRVVEFGPVEEVLLEPAHPYTQALVVAAGLADRSAAGKNMRGESLRPTAARGCHYASRCPLVHPRCREEEPPLEEVRRGHIAACWLVVESRQSRAPVSSAAAPPVAADISEGGSL